MSKKLTKTQINHIERRIGEEVCKLRSEKMPRKEKYMPKEPKAVTAYRQRCIAAGQKYRDDCDALERKLRDKKQEIIDSLILQDDFDMATALKELRDAIK